MALQRIKRLAAIGAAIALAGAAFADDMPFWGEGSPSTNRVAAVATSTQIAHFCSRPYYSAQLVLNRFNSTKPSLIIMVF